MIASAITTMSASISLFAYKRQFPFSRVIDLARGGVLGQPRADEVSSVARQ
jgi:hypothetical protein